MKAITSVQCWIHHGGYNALMNAWRAKMGPWFGSTYLQNEDDGLRRIALLKMEGLSNREVATRLNCAERTIERRIKLIRNLWTQRTTSDGDL